eukprot:11520823-Alexandrium_andersonii.AAC.1
MRPVAPTLALQDVARGRVARAPAQLAIRTQELACGCANGLSSHAQALQSSPMRELRVREGATPTAMCARNRPLPRPSR